MPLIEVEHRASELHNILLKSFGEDAKLQADVAHHPVSPDQSVAPCGPQEGERLYVYHGLSNGRKVELAVAEHVFERFGVLEILRSVWAADSIVKLEGHRTLVYVDDGLLRYRPMATVN